MNRRIIQIPIIIIAAIAFFYRDSILELIGQIPTGSIPIFMIVFCAAVFVFALYMTYLQFSSQSKISKIEDAFDQDITIKDLLDYGKALNLHLEIGYRHPSAKVVDLIKYHAFKIRSYLNMLTGLAKDDEKLKESIADFHLEALFNICKIIAVSLSKLDFTQKVKKKEEQLIHFSAPIEKLKELEKLAESNFVRK